MVLGLGREPGSSGIGAWASVIVTSPSCFGRCSLLQSLTYFVSMDLLEWRLDVDLEIYKQIVISD